MVARKKRRTGSNRRKASTSQSPGELNTDTWLYNRASRETDRVAKRLNKELRKRPLIDLLTEHFGSLLYFAAQRLIERKKKTGEERPQDEAVILSCSRLFNESFAGIMLARHGLVLQSIVLLRSAFEVASQAILFMEQESMAVQWLKGKRIQPREVRSKSSFAAAHKDLYNSLARLSHPNLEAAYYHSSPVSGQPHVGLAYGGWYAPKSVAQIIVQFLFAELVFLEAFYTAYDEDLRKQELLWMPATVEAAKALGKDDVPIEWHAFLGAWRQALTDLAAEYGEMPEDHSQLSAYLARQMETLSGEAFSSTKG